MPDPPLSERTAKLAKTFEPLLQYIQRTYTPLATRSEVDDFALGNPHEPPLQGIVEALQRGAVPRKNDWFAYPFSMPSAQEVVAASLRRWRCIPFENEDVVLTTGAFGALLTALTAVTDPGDEVVYSLPPWFFYETFMVETGLVPVAVRHNLETFDLDLGAIEAAITSRTRLVLVNTPCNPTGKIYSAATLERLGRLLESASKRVGHTIYLLSDEPYSRIIFDNRSFRSPTEFYPATLLSYSYAKVLLTPGQRLGFLAWTPRMPRREELRQNVFVAQNALGYAYPNALLQHAIGDLDHLSIDVGHIQRKRDWMVEALRSMGYELHSPEGAFYLLPKSPWFDDVAFTNLMAENNVLVLPGKVLRAPGYFRVSLTASDAMIKRGLSGFAAAIARARTEPPSLHATP